MTPTAPREIDATPDFHALFSCFIRDAENAGLNIQNNLRPCHHANQAPLLRTIQGLIAPLTIAAQCATNLDEIQQLRETLASILSHLDRTARETEQAEIESECGF